MSAIKRFFEKKKVEAKFKMAGPGQKLGDAQAASAAAHAAGVAAASSSSGSSSGKAPKRGVLTDQQQLAASAAMERLNQAASSSGDFEKNRAQASIRAMARKELEEEKQREDEVNRLKNTYGEKKSVELEGPSMLSCEGIFYKCDLIEDGRVLPKSEMRQKIHDFLYSQLGTEDKGLTACLIIHTLNKDVEKVRVGIETLSKYLDNIVQNPLDEKFRKIKNSNKAFVERVSRLEGSDIFLSAAGFESVSLDSQDFWKFPDVLLDEVESRQRTLDNLTMLKDALSSAEPVKAELDRGLKVLLPGRASQEFRLPPDFFSLSADEIKREQQTRSEEVEREGILRTKAMREREEQREKRKYRFTLIRVRFPDGLVLQGTFSVYEKYSALLDFVRDCLEHPLPFVLHDPIRGVDADNQLESQTLLDLKLVPSAILTFAWHPDVAKEIELQLSEGMNEGEKPFLLRHDLVESALGDKGSQR